jgi:pimeloyl-ACP methyl ester carboxylesterase
MHLPLSGIDLARIGAELEVESGRCAAIERESFFGCGMLAQIQAQRILANAYGPHHPPLDNSLANRWTQQFKAAGAEHALQTMAGRTLPGFPRATIQKLHVRATVVWGAEDSVDSLREGRQTAADLHAHFVLIPNAGHLSLLSAPGRVARAIEATP